MKLTQSLALFFKYLR